MAGGGLEEAAEEEEEEELEEEELELDPRARQPVTLPQRATAARLPWRAATRAWRRRQRGARTQAPMRAPTMARTRTSRWPLRLVRECLLFPAFRAESFPLSATFGEASERSGEGLEGPSDARARARRR